MCKWGLSVHEPAHAQMMSIEVIICARSGARASGGCLCTHRCIHKWFRL